VNRYFTATLAAVAVGFIGSGLIALYFLRPSAVRQQVAVERWAQLHRYTNDNKSFTKPSSGENPAVFFGDSITYYWDLGKYFPGKRYINRGIKEQTTSQLLLRFRRDVIALKPAAVVILGGINDIAEYSGPMSLETIQNNYASMADLAAQNRIATVFGSILPVNDYAGAAVTARRSPEKIREVNAWLQNYCAQGHCTYIDYYRAMIDERGMLRVDFSHDGVHPNATAYGVMAPLAQSAIDKAVGSERESLAPSSRFERHAHTR